MEKLFACFWFSFLLEERPALSRAEGIKEWSWNKEKMSEKFERNKGDDKTFTRTTVSCSEKRRQEKENEMALEISRRDEWLRHLAKFSCACALSFPFKSLSSCILCFLLTTKRCAISWYNRLPAASWIRF